MSLISWNFPSKLTIQTDGEYKLFDQISGNDELQIKNLDLNSKNITNSLYLCNMREWKIFKFQLGITTRYLLKIPNNSILNQFSFQKHNIPIIFYNQGKYLYIIKYPIKLPGLFLEIKKINRKKFREIFIEMFNLTDIVFPNLTVKNKYHFYDFSIIKDEDPRIQFIFELLITIDSKYFNLNKILQIIYCLNSSNLDILNKCLQIYKFPELYHKKVKIINQYGNENDDTRYNLIPELLTENLERFYKENIILKCHLLNCFKNYQISVQDIDNQYINKFKEIRTLCHKMYLSNKKNDLKCYKCEIKGDYTTLLGEYKYNICRWCFQKDLDCFPNKDNYQKIVQHENKLKNNNWSLTDIVKQRPIFLGY